MKGLKAKPDYFTFLKYLLIFALFFIIASVESDFSIYSVSFLAVILELNVSMLLSSALFLSTFLIMGKIGLISSAIIPVIILISCNAIYKKIKVVPKFETFAFITISMLGFVFIGDTSIHIPIEKRIYVSILTVLLTAVLKTSISAIIKKGLKFKFGYEEFATTAITAIIVGLGLCNLLSPDVWKIITVLVVLFASFFYKTGVSILISSAFGICLALYNGNINCFTAVLCWSVIAECFMPVSRYLSAIGIIACDYFLHYAFAIYPTYQVFQLICMILGSFIFCIIPSKALKTLKEKLYSFREKQLIRETVNRNRVMTSNRLYELSNVFSEMKEAFVSFKKHTVSEDVFKSTIEKETITNICLNCENKSKCKEKHSPKKADLERLIDVGFAKGKISFVDVPSGILSTCIHPNNILYFINKLLADYRSRKIDEMNFSSGRELVAMQAEGVSEILKRLALETGTLLKYHNRLERDLATNLFKEGFTVNEILIYGEESKIFTGIIVEMKEFSLEILKNIISKTLGFSVTLFEKVDISPDKCYLSFKKAPKFDAIFGLASAMKDGSLASGDSHSIMRIKEDRFMVAVSDGMGSGNQAKNVSEVSLSLIESFYKAGLNSNAILNTVNKLLAINLEDSFTALDISVINLNDGSVDFIKYGSPYGFIISDKGIKIIEGNTLPLGILEELSPSVCSANLNDGDIVLLVSDGISDAFGSSGDLLDYLRTAPAFNPQTLANDILKKAVEINDGIKKDDMTALAVRVFKPKQNIVA